MMKRIYGIMLIVVSALLVKSTVSGLLLMPSILTFGGFFVGYEVFHYPLVLAAVWACIWILWKRTMESDQDLKAQTARVLLVVGALLVMIGFGAVENLDEPSADAGTIRFIMSDVPKSGGGTDDAVIIYDMGSGEQDPSILVSKSPMAQMMGYSDRMRLQEIQFSPSLTAGDLLMIVGLGFMRTAAGVRSEWINAVGPVYQAAWGFLVIWTTIVGINAGIQTVTGMMHLERSMILTVLPTVLAAAVIGIGSTRFGAMLDRPQEKGQAFMISGLMLLITLGVDLLRSGADEMGQVMVLKGLGVGVGVVMLLLGVRMLGRTENSEDQREAL